MKQAKEKITHIPVKGFKQYIPTIIAALLLALVLYEISFYIFRTYRAFFNSDAAIANILAEEIVLAGSFFPSHWWYVNNDLWVFYKQALVIPWVILGKNGYFAHAFTVFLVSVFMVFFIYKFFRALMLSHASSLMGGVVVCIAYSPMYLRELYGEAAYTWYFIFMIAFLYMFRKLSPHVIRRSTKIKAFFLFLILLYILVLANPIRFLVYYVAPFFGALMLMVILSRDSEKTLHDAVIKLLSIKKVIIFICAMCIIGFATVAHYSLIESLHFSGGANNAELMPLEALPVHIAHAFLGLINFIGAEWNNGVVVSSFEGVVSLAKFFLYPMVLVFPALYIKRNYYQMSSSERMTVLYSYVGFAIIMLLYSLTSLHEHAWSARNNIRYISPFLMMILLCNVIMWRFFPMMVKAILALCLAMSIGLSWNYISPKDWRCKVDERIALVEELKNHGLIFGYATYWDSHVYTVFSDGEVDIRPIKFTDSGFSAETWLSSDGWYQKDASPGKVFFLTNGENVDAFYNGMKKMNMPDPIEQFSYGDYTIIVFEKNPLYVKKTKAEARKKKRIIMAP